MIVAGAGDYARRTGAERIAGRALQAAVFRRRDDANWHEDHAREVGEQ